MASAVTAYYQAFGSDAPPPTYDDVECRVPAGRDEFPALSDERTRQPLTARVGSLVDAPLTGEAPVDGVGRVSPDAVEAVPTVDPLLEVATADRTPHARRRRPLAHLPATARSREARRPCPDDAPPPVVSETNRLNAYPLILDEYFNKAHYNRFDSSHFQFSEHNIHMCVHAHVSVRHTRGAPRDELSHRPVVDAVPDG
jgi:hypothetical protein